MGPAAFYPRVVVKRLRVNNKPPQKCGDFPYKYDP